MVREDGPLFGSTMGVEGDASSGLTRNLVLSVCDMRQNGDIPPPLVGARMVTLGTRVYLFGGADEQKNSDGLFVLEIERGSWKECEPRSQLAPKARYGHSMTKINNNQILVFGGMIEDDDETNSTSEPTFAPPPLIWPTLETSHIRLWRHRGVPSNDCWKFDILSMKWTRFSALESDGAPPPLAFHESVAVVPNSETEEANYLIVWGGSSNSEFQDSSSSLYVLDLANNKWIKDVKQEGDIPTPRIGHRMVYNPITCCVTLFGGDAEDRGLYSLDCASLFEYCNDNDTAQGRELTDSAPSITLTWRWLDVGGTAPLARSFHSTVLIGESRLLVFGGVTSAITSSDAYAFDFDKQRWIRPLFDGEICLSGHASAVLHDKLLIFGGSRPPLTELQQLGSLRAASQGEIHQHSASSTPAAPAFSKQSLGSRPSHKLFFVSVLEVRHSSASSTQQQQRFKIVTVGDSGVGKSCLLQRFVQDTYMDRHNVTVGVDFFNAVAMIKGRLVTLQFWDTAGQERFSSLSGNYYRNADGFILVYDATRPDTFYHITKWIDHIKENKKEEPGAKSMFLIIGNKQDLKEQIQVSDADGKDLADQLEAIYLGTSALTGAGVDTAFLLAASRLVFLRDSQKSVKGWGSGDVQTGRLALTTQSAATTITEACRIC